MTQIEITNPQVYLAFLKHVSSNIEEASPQMQRRLIRSVINNIVVHKNHVEAFYYASREVIERNWAALKVDSSPSAQNDIHKKNLNNVANTLTNGAPGRTRTYEAVIFLGKNAT